MSQLVETRIEVRMSPPVVVALVPEHLPAPVRAAHDTMRSAIANKYRVETELASAAPADKAEQQKALDAGTATMNATINDFMSVNAASATAMSDQAHACFVAAMDQANAAVRAALDALEDATQAAALHASVTPGRPVLRLDGQAASDAPVRFPLSMARSNLREILSQLPDSLD